VRRARGAAKVAYDCSGRPAPIAASLLLAHLISQSARAQFVIPRKRE
jgi:hypothetical protein